MQRTITLSPVNYYQGIVNLSCGKVPANVTCTFSPPAFSADGSGVQIPGTLTVNTNGGSPIVGQVNQANRVPKLYAALLLRGGLTGFMVLLFRTRFPKNLRVQAWLLLFVLLGGVAG